MPYAEHAKREIRGEIGKMRCVKKGGEKTEAAGKNMDTNKAYSNTGEKKEYHAKGKNERQGKR